MPEEIIINRNIIIKLLIIREEAWRRFVILHSIWEYYLQYFYSVIIIDIVDYNKSTATLKLVKVPLNWLMNTE